MNSRLLESSLSAGVREGKPSFVDWDGGAVCVFFWIEISQDLSQNQKSRRHPATSAKWHHKYQVQEMWSLWNSRRGVSAFWAHCRGFRMLWSFLAMTQLYTWMKDTKLLEAVWWHILDYFLDMHSPSSPQVLFSLLSTVFFGTAAIKSCLLDLWTDISLAQSSIVIFAWLEPSQMLYLDVAHNT